MIGKIDHYFSASTTLAGSYSYDNTMVTVPDAFNLKLGQVVFLDDSEDQFLLFRGTVPGLSRRAIMMRRIISFVACSVSGAFDAICSAYS